MTDPVNALDTARSLLFEGKTTLERTAESMSGAEFVIAAAVLATGFVQLAAAEMEAVTPAARMEAKAGPHDEVIELRAGQQLTCFGRSARVTETAIEFHIGPGLRGNVMRLADEGGRLVLREGGEGPPRDDEETDAEREARFDAAALDVVARVSGPLPFTSDDVGEQLLFRPTGSIRRIVAVDETDQMLTFEVIGDPEDRTTESFADLAKADAVVLRG